VSEFEDEIVKAYQSGMSIKKIRKEYGVKLFQFYYILGKRGLDLRITTKSYAEPRNVAKCQQKMRLLVPVNIMKQLGMVAGKYYKFTVISKEGAKFTLEVEEVEKSST